ncbi:MAG: flagellar basal-body rod protein FlgF [Alphaproteobacteria bacterium]|nr:flagellar basal-body rod protein FlgF [Alphaproteobacteria bacterium]
MDASLSISLSNQMALRRKMDVIANNLANLSTTGFKREIPLFEERPVNVSARDAEGGERNLMLTYVEDWGTLRDMSDGQMLKTGNPLDLGIAGDGFFQVQTPDGIRYTRNGAFTLDDTGRIVTSDGYPLLDDGGGEIVVDPTEGDLAVAKDGTLSNETGIIGRIGLVTFDPTVELKKTGSSLFEADASPLPADDASILQGTIERSNVEAVVEMTEMIEVMRAYQHSTDLIGTSEEMTRRAVQKLGEVRA